MAKHKGQFVGYVRVSTLDQHTERQLETKSYSLANEYQFAYTPAFLTIDPHLSTSAFKRAGRTSRVA